MHSLSQGREGESEKVCLRVYLFSVFLEQAGRIELRSDFEITDRELVGGWAGPPSLNAEVVIIAAAACRRGWKKVSDSLRCDASHVCSCRSEVRR